MRRKYSCREMPDIHLPPLTTVVVLSMPLKDVTNLQNNSVLAKQITAQMLEGNYPS